METREKNQTRLSRWWGRCPARHGLLLLSLLWLGVYFATRQNRPWMGWLCRALVRPWHRTAGRFYSLVRFSAAEWIIALWILMGIAFLVQGCICLARRDGGGAFYRWIVSVLTMASVLFGLFSLWWASFIIPAPLPNRRDWWTVPSRRRSWKL